MTVNANVERSEKEDRGSKIENREANVEDRSAPHSSIRDLKPSTFDPGVPLQLSVILLAGLFIHGLWLGDSPLDRTEPFRALVAHQMVKGGSWLVPHLYGEVYLRKPPLMYWIQAGVENCFGRGDEFVWRFPSAMGSALLAVFVAWWSSRWFGRQALLPAGFACLSLIALWDQDRGADIDALNTLFAVVASACVLELLYGSGRRRAAWCFALGLSLAATLLLKGPGGLPQALAAMIGPALFLWDFKTLKSRATWLALGSAIGIAIFAAYIIAARHALDQLHVPPDQTGWYEVIDKVLLPPLGVRAKALFIQIEVVAFAVPVLMVLPFAVILMARLPMCDTHRIRAVALLGTVAVALVVWCLSANVNPRYEYVVLPLLAPLVGFVWVHWRNRESGFTQALLGIAVLLCAAVVVLSHRQQKLGTHIATVDAVAAIAGMATVALFVAFAIRRKLANQLAGPVVIMLVLLFAVPMAARKNAERRRKSSARVSMQIHSIIGDAKRVSAAGLVRDLPELFYYADVDVDNYGEFGLPQLADARGGHWVVLADTIQYPAYSTIVKSIPNAFPRGAVQLHMPDPHDIIFVGWYDPPASSSTHVEWNVLSKANNED